MGMEVTGEAEAAEEEEATGDMEAAEEEALEEAEQMAEEEVASEVVVTEVGTEATEVEASEVEETGVAAMEAMVVEASEVEVTEEQEEEPETWDRLSLEEERQELTTPSSPPSPILDSPAREGRPGTTPILHRRLAARWVWVPVQVWELRVGVGGWGRA